MDIQNCSTKIKKKASLKSDNTTAEYTIKHFRDEESEKEAEVVGPSLGRFKLSETLYG